MDSLRRLSHLEFLRIVPVLRLSCRTGSFDTKGPEKTTMGPFYFEYGSTRTTERDGNERRDPKTQPKCLITTLLVRETIGNNCRKQLGNNCYGKQVGNLSGGSR